MAPLLTSTTLEDFLKPLRVDVQKCHALARSLHRTYERLAKEAEDQFLPTPVSESILRPEKDAQGNYLAIDIGGTNLRVGFIELRPIALGTNDGSCISQYNDTAAQSCAARHFEKSWPIGEQLKNNQAEDLFAWIGACIGEVVKEGCESSPGKLPDPLPLGLTFSFPMVQHTLSTATLMTMGKDFALSSDLDLGHHILRGYESSRDPSLPGIKITAIANDTVATLVSFFYQLRMAKHRKPVMGLIVGTGTNATIPLALAKLQPSKRPSIYSFESSEKIAVNTEWTIKGAAPPLHEHGLVTKWDAKLDAEGLAPGFQPFEYMTAGRYLGELGRIIIVEYFTDFLNIPTSALPRNLVTRYGLSTTFLGNVSADPEKAAQQLENELPPSITHGQNEEPVQFTWTPITAQCIYQIAKAIQTRASAMVAAAILGLLATADELTLDHSLAASNEHRTQIESGQPESVEKTELLVGYTGGCIAHFQDYLQGCQYFLDTVVTAGVIEGKHEGNKQHNTRVVLEACHNGGILGAGILAGIVESMEKH